MTGKSETSEATPSLVFFRSAEEERRIFCLLHDYLSRRGKPHIRSVLSLELRNLADNDRERALCSPAQRPLRSLADRR